MGLKPDEFWQMTFSQFELAYKAFVYKEEMQWVHTRYQVAMLLNVHRKAKAKPIKPEDLIELSFDKKRKPRVPVKIERYTKEQILEMKRLDGIGIKPNKTPQIHKLFR